MQNNINTNANIPNFSDVIYSPYIEKYLPVIKSIVEQCFHDGKHFTAKIDYDDHSYLLFHALCDKFPNEYMVKNYDGTSVSFHIFDQLKFSEDETGRHCIIAINPVFASLGKDSVIEYFKHCLYQLPDMISTSDSSFPL